MTIIEFSKQINKEELGLRVRAILGVPEEFLTDDVISSPIFEKSASKYVNKKISKYEDKIEDIDEELLKIAYIYYICYQLCSGMYARLPKQMENLSTKTILLSIDWDSKALEMLNQVDNLIDEALLDVVEEDSGYGNSFAVLTSESEYPNTLI